MTEEGESEKNHQEQIHQKKGFPRHFAKIVVEKDVW
jgi:hypothetical protein